MATTPPTITLLPTPPSSADPSSFDVRADTFLEALPDFTTEANALATNVYNNAVAAATSTDDAATQASTATTQAGIATTQASTATTQAGIATTQAGIATTQADNAAGTYISFDSRYLGVKSASPTLDNQGSALVIGAMYFSSTLNNMQIYTGSAWVTAAGQIVGTFSILRESHTATAGQTIFNLTNMYTVGTNTIMVYKNGVRLLAADYVETSSSVVTVTSAASSGDEYFFEIGVVSSGNLTSAANTTFSPAGGLTSGNVQAAITELDTEKQTVLVSGTNIKTLNGGSLLGGGDIAISSSVILVSRTANTILGIPDNSKLIDITSGTFTQTFDAAATLGDGWFCYIRNSGTGDITLDPNASETIDGLTSYVMYPGEVRLVQCDGAALLSIVLNTFYKTFASSGTFTKPPGYSCICGRVWGGGSSGARSGSAGAGVYGGAGGGCGEFAVPASAVGTTETVTVGAGGAAYTGSDAGGGNSGGNSSFGSFLTAYKGNTNATGGSIVQALMASTSALPVGYEGGQKDATTTQRLSGVWGGGGASNTLASGNSVYGGAAGGSITSANALLSPGTSLMGGNGGAAATGTNGTAGSTPGGGGGATQTGTSAGAGARGEVRIWGIV